MEKITHLRIKIIFIAGTILLLSLSLFSYLRIDSLIISSAWVNHTNVVKLELANFYTTVKEVESAQRAYMLTHDTEYLNDYNFFVSKIAPHLNRLHRLTKDSYTQENNVEALDSLVRIRIENLDSSIKLGSLKLISSESRLLFRFNRDALRSKIKQMMIVEENLLRAREKSLLKEYTITPVFTIFLIIFSILILVISYYGINRELKTSNLLKSNLEERTQQLLVANNSLLTSNQAIVVNNESLAKMNKELESFTYISSHDLQEPLRKIQTFITRIIEKESDKLSDSGRNYLNRTQESANRMQTLIRDLLAYSRLNAEIFPVENISLSTLISEVTNELEEEINDKEATIQVIGNSHIKIIVSQFRQLLINLISNSIKFSDATKKPHITIENMLVQGRDTGIKDLADNQEYSKLTISDNGIGFDAQYKSRIFEVFQRLHIDPKYPGTGIGLAIVKKIVENHKGYITANGEVGKGAVFTIYIPA